MLRSIDTTYNGYRFRSRLEARWAVFFDALGIKYVYEPEGVVLKNGTPYLPDFWLPELKFFVEVKGDLSNKDNLVKAKNLDDYPPHYAWGCFIFSSLDYAKLVTNTDSPPDFNSSAIKSSWLGVSIHDFNKAIDKARSARFEFTRYTIRW